MPLPIVRTMSMEGRLCYLQSFVAIQISGKQDGNLLQVVNPGAQASVDFKGKMFSQQTKFLFKRLKSTATESRDVKVQLQWQANENYYLAAVGKSLVIESTANPTQPKYEFIVEKARPSHAFMFKNTACLSQDFAYINSDENGRVFMGPGSNKRPQAWVNMVFPDWNNNVDGAPAHARTKIIGDMALNCGSNHNSVIKLWKSKENPSYCEMLSYV